jgi:hypothetical protein
MEKILKNKKKISKNMQDYFELKIANTDETNFLLDKEI